MGFQQTIDLVQCQSFRLRVTAAVVTAAGQINGESVTSGYEDYYVKRSTLAQRVFVNPDGVSPTFVWLCAANPTIASTGLAASDGDIQYVVNSSWDDVAGVMTTDAHPT